MDFPQNYNSPIVGQERAVSILSKYISVGSVPPALLFVGYKGVGRMKTALEFARALNCEIPENRRFMLHHDKKETLLLCDCRSCKSLRAGSHPSVIIVDEKYQKELTGKENAGGTTGIDTVREIQRALSLKLPDGTKKTVVIVDSAEALSREAADAFLKTLEEPSSTACLILLAPSRRTLPRTITSRCQTIFFRRLSGDEIAGIIKRIRPDAQQQQIFSDEMMRIFSSSGSVSEALEIVDNYDYYSKVLMENKFRYMEITAKDFKKDSDAAAFINYLALSTRDEFLKDPDKKLYIREAILDALKLLSSGVNRIMVLSRLHAGLYGIKE